MKFITQMYLLLWKNSILFSRRWYTYLIELAMPVVVCILLIFLRKYLKIETFDDPIPYTDLQLSFGNILTEYDKKQTKFHSFCFDVNDTRFFTSQENASRSFDVDPFSPSEIQKNDYKINVRHTKNAYCNGTNAFFNKLLDFPPIYFTPITPLSQTLMSRMASIVEINAEQKKQTYEEYLELSEQEKLRKALMNATGMDSESDMEIHNAKTYGFLTRFYIVFENIKMSTLPKILKFKVRFGGQEYYHDRLNLNSKELFNPKASFDHSDTNTRPWEGYGYTLQPSRVLTQYISLNAIISKAAYKQWASEQTPDVDQHTLQLRIFKGIKFDFPPYCKDNLLKMINVFLPYTAVLAFLMTVVTILKSVVVEKETGIKEIMRMMGMQEVAITVSWYLTFALTIVPQIFIFALLLKFDRLFNKQPVLRLSDGKLLFILFYIYGMSLISFSLMVSSFMAKSANTALVAISVSVLFAMPYSAKVFLGESTFHLMMYNLFNNSAMVQALAAVVSYEAEGVGVQFSNMASPPNVESDLSLVHHMAMMALDTILYLVIAWYINNVKPGDFGIGLPLYFPFLPSFWLGEKGLDENTESEARDETYFQKDPEGLIAGIQIQELRKKFGPKCVVDSISANMYEGQIFCLLGHNGAGKTTTMQMLTGFIKPSSGTAKINGCDIRTNIAGVRSSLGFCPQHDILWDDLTVYEHLMFFSMLKGADGPAESAKTTTREVGLGEKINVRAGALSGGMRRKLCVGMALVGNSKVVFLDEPTAGMDVGARRQTWDVLQAARKGRTVVLSTHYMDEADVLGDRIGIMADGRFQCLGSPMFLKKLYGVGYHMVLVMGDPRRVEEIIAYVQERIMGAEHTETVNREVTMLLPEGALRTFAALFRSLDNDKYNLDVTSYGINATTMEEVFLKAGAHPAEHTEAGGQDEVVIDEYLAEQPKLSGISLEVGRVSALSMKYFLIAWQTRLNTAIQLLIPISFVLLSVNLPDPFAAETYENMDMSLALFKNTKIPYSCLTATGDEIAAQQFCKSYEKQFTSIPGLEGHTMHKFNNAPDAYLFPSSEAMKYDSFTAFKKSVIGMVANVSVESLPAGNITTLDLYVLYNIASWHGLPVSIFHAYNAMLGFLTKDQLYIETSLFPMELIEGSITIKSLFSSLVQLRPPIITFGIIVTVAMFLAFCCRDRTTGAKHLQTLSGVGPATYWLSILLCDFTVYLVAILLHIILLLILDYKPWVSGFSIGPYLILTLCFAIGFLPQVYLISNCIDKPTTGIGYILIISFFICILCPFVVTILNLIDMMMKKTLGRDTDRVFCLLFSPYNLVGGIIDIEKNYNNNEYCKPPHKGAAAVFCGKDCEILCRTVSDSFALDGNGISDHLWALLAQGAVFSILLWVKERGLLSKLSGGGGDQAVGTDNSDSDVAEAANRVLDNSAEVIKSDAIVMLGTTKKYGNFTSVDRATIGIGEGDCFGLLGQNGAGKTTCFKMITGDVPITGGDIYVKGFSVKKQLHKVQSLLGYCPQYGGLTGELSARQMVVLFARLKGTAKADADRVSKALLDELTLTPHADKLCGRYSGGNKRKLSIAVALVGNPPVVMLDEPTAGVDVAARREIWNTLAKVRKRGNTLILTTHSMEECDALCTSLVIMVNGKFHCLGSPQHLKTKFGQGFTLTAQLDTTEDGEACDAEPIKEYILAEFPGAEVFDEHAGYVHFTVPEYAASLADLFEVMESVKMDKSKANRRSSMFGSMTAVDVNANFNENTISTTQGGSTENFNAPQGQPHSEYENQGPPGHTSQSQFSFSPSSTDFNENTKSISTTQGQSTANFNENTISTTEGGSTANFNAPQGQPHSEYQNQGRFSQQYNQTPGPPSPQFNQPPGPPGQQFNRPPGPPGQQFNRPPGPPGQQFNRPPGSPGQQNYQNQGWDQQGWGQEQEKERAAREPQDVIMALRVVDYAVAQTSLEQVFLSFAKYQKSAPVAVPTEGMCSKCCCCCCRACGCLKKE